jgi:HEAT repeat protein
MSEKRIEELQALLAGSNRVGQIRAALDLVNVGNQQAEDTLISALGNSNEHSRACAAMALGKMGSVRAVPRLEKLLQGNTFTHFFRERSPEVRQTIAFVLSQIGQPSSVAALEYAVQNDESEEVRTEAKTALEKHTIKSR